MRRINKRDNSKRNKIKLSVKGKKITSKTKIIRLRETGTKMTETRVKIETTIDTRIETIIVTGIVTRITIVETKMIETIRIVLITMTGIRITRMALMIKTKTKIETTMISIKRSLT